MRRFWYAFNNFYGADPSDRNNYSRMTIKPGCRNGPVLCAIYAPGFLAPDYISTNIINYIANGQATKLAQPQFPVNAKFFVYMKSN